MNSPLLLLVSRSDTRIHTYRSVLDELGVSSMPVSSITEGLSLAAGTAFSGILLDMPVVVKASVKEKTEVEDLLKALPSAYINIAPATDAIKLMVATGMQGIATNIDEFVELCKGFTPRIVTPKDRYPLHLHAILKNVVNMNYEEQTVTMNVSANGCFLFTSHAHFNIGDTVLIKFVGLTETSAITATISWLNRWGGKVDNIPGIGVKFDSISDIQQREIQILLESFRNK